MSNQTDKNNQKIRAAMDRLLIGSPLHTDGKLNVKNLALEAGLTRQQIYRSDLLNEFNEHVERIRSRQVEPTEIHLKRIQKLQDELKAEKARSAKYKKEKEEALEFQKMMANQIQFLNAKLEKYELNNKN